jgi:hypothetical protein
MLEADINLFSIALVFQLLLGSTCAILIARWAWREAKQYVQARGEMQKILKRLSGECRNVSTKD